MLSPLTHTHTHTFIVSFVHGVFFIYTALLAWNLFWRQCIWILFILCSLTLSVHSSIWCEFVCAYRHTHILSLLLLLLLLLSFFFIPWKSWHWFSLFAKQIEPFNRLCYAMSVEGKKKKMFEEKKKMKKKKKETKQHNFIEFHLLANSINRWLNWFPRYSLFIWSTIAIVKDVYVCLFFRVCVCVFALVKKKYFESKINISNIFLFFVCECLL